MRQKLLVERKLDNFKISLTNLENMISLSTITRKDLVNEINFLKDKLLEIQILIGNESEEFN